MVELIVGRRGKGKTKQLLDKANASIQDAVGTVVYLDKSAQHMYELNNRIRLINVNEFPITSADAFVGFVSGILSQDRDLQYMFFDSFLKLAELEGEDITTTMTALKTLSEKYKVTFVISLSLDKEEIPDAFKEDIVVAL